MRWRLSSSGFNKSSKSERIQALEDLVTAGEPVGILAYSGEMPVGWCSIAPKTQYAALNRSRTIPKIDDRPVWSIVCFFIDAKFRKQGLTLGLLQAAVAYAQSEGAMAVEGYPVDPSATSYTYMGSPQTFERAGFIDVTPAGQKRRVMRYFINMISSNI